MTTFGLIAYFVFTILVMALGSAPNTSEDLEIRTRLLCYLLQIVGSVIFFSMVDVKEDLKYLKRDYDRDVKILQDKVRTLESDNYRHNYKIEWHDESIKGLEKRERK